jgi:type I restriction enzyme, S subunit
MIPDDRSATNQQINAVICNAEHDPHFIYYRLYKDRGSLERAAVKTTVPILNKTNFESFEIIVPPLAEQRKIAAVLGLVQRAIEQQERMITLTIELKKALFYKLFTEALRGEPQKQTEIGPVPESWEIRRLSDIFECLDGCRVPIRESDRIRGPYPYYGASGIVDYVSDFIFEGLYLLVAEDGENLEITKATDCFYRKWEVLGK